MMADPSRGRTDPLQGAGRKASEVDCISLTDRTSPEPHKAGEGGQGLGESMDDWQTYLTRPGPESGVGKGPESDGK